VQDFGGVTCGEEPLGRPVDGQTLLKLVFMKEWVDMDWIDIGQDKDKWRAFVNAALKLRIP
jgi:hypothetical protein